MSSSIRVRATASKLLESASKLLASECKVTSELYRMFAFTLYNYTVNNNYICMYGIIFVVPCF